MASTIRHARVLLYRQGAFVGRGQRASEIKCAQSSRAERSRARDPQCNATGRVNCGKLDRQENKPECRQIQNSTQPPRKRRSEDLKRLQRDRVGPPSPRIDHRTTVKRGRLQVQRRCNAKVRKSSGRGCDANCPRKNRARTTDDVEAMCWEPTRLETANRRTQSRE
jgi:hypothetical protein